MKTCPSGKNKCPNKSKYCGNCQAALPKGKNNVFISYRRENGDTVAVLLYELLTAKGYNVFLDVEKLHSGDFNEELFEAIDGCSDFILVCSPNCLHLFCQGLFKCFSEILTFLS